LKDSEACEEDSKGGMERAAQSIASEVTTIEHRLIEHRLVHNAYGALQASATYDGLSRRDENERPFLLSRSFFVGSQRWGALWTGDNTATWEQLRLAARMILSLGASGLPFSGADVGGFFGEPTAELLVRWYQLASFQPFFRGHAHIDSARREPWLLSDETSSLVIEAIRERQRLLPLWSTLFWGAASDPAERGLPIARPLWLRFEADKAHSHSKSELLREEAAWMLGDDILVRPITHPSQRSLRVYLPIFAKVAEPLGAETNSPTLWYDVNSGKRLQGGGWHDTAAPLHITPRWQRGGSIVPRREIVRRSALIARWGPLTLHIAPDASGAAYGRVFLDDGVSFNYSRGGGVLVSLRFECAKNRCILSSTPRPLPGVDSFALSAPVFTTTVLVRGARVIEPAISAVYRSEDPTTWTQELVSLEVQPSSHGVLLQRLRASCVQPWTLELPSIALG